MPPRAASSAFTSATMRAMAASSAAVVILAARALAMQSLSRAAPPLRQSNLARETNPPLQALTLANPTDIPRITPASCLEAPTLSTCICSIAEAWF